MSVRRMSTFNSDSESDQPKPGEHLVFWAKLVDKKKYKKSELKCRWRSKPTERQRFFRITQNALNTVAEYRMKNISSGSL